MPVRDGEASMLERVKECEQLVYAGVRKGEVSV